MSKITIKTLTPVHIGSGTEYQKNFEFLYFANEKKTVFIDAEKVLKIIGEDNLDQWVSCIDKKQSLMQLLVQRKPNIVAVDVAMRSLKTHQEPQKDSIREQIHSGSGKVLLPGSSIKGSLRTAIFAENMMDNADLAKNKSNFSTTNKYNDRIQYTDKFLKNEIFGNSANNDIFRLLQVGDAHFETTEIFRTDVINKYDKDWKLKESIAQFIEAIPAAQTSTFELRFNELLQKSAGRLFNDNSQQLPLTTLFEYINNHTRRLLEDELDYWRNKENEPAELGDYCDNLDDILTKINCCSNNECILRIGWGTGFRNITGDWHGTMTDDDYYDMVKEIRKNYPETLVFPKTTRFIQGGMPLGFIKLKILN